MNKLFSRAPFLGIWAFMIILISMGLGHSVMILIQKLVPADYVYLAAIGLGLLGLYLIKRGIKAKSDTTATLNGLFGGLFIWTGWIEFSFVYIAQRYAVEPLVENGEVVTNPEYLIMPSSLGLLALFMVVFVLNTNTYCTFFNWLQRALKINRPDIKRVKFRDRPVALTTTIEAIMLLWFFYILLLLTYDDRLFGDRHPVTYIIAFGSLLWSIYLIRKLLRIKRFGYALRYALPTVIIFWNVVEIFGRWNLLNEIWVEPLAYWLEMSIFFLVMVGLIVVFYIEDRREKKLAKTT